MSTIAEQLEALKNLMDETTSTLTAYTDGIIRNLVEVVPVALPIPWQSQLGASANYAPGDCGPACWASWARYLGHDGVTPDQVSARTGLRPGYNYSMPAHLIRAARHWGHNLYWRRDLSIDDLRAEIDAGQPCIVLVHYGSLPHDVRYDKKYTSGHWLLIIGYDDNNVIYLDPYNTNAEDGTVTMSWHRFLTAWFTNYLDGNSNRQALRLRR